MCADVAWVKKHKDHTMKKLLKSTTSLGLALAMSLPQIASAQAARCQGNLNAYEFPCAMPTGEVVNDKMEALNFHEAHQLQRIDELKLAISQADRDVVKDTSALISELKTMQERLTVTRSEMAKAQADGQEAAQAQNNAAEKARKEAERAASEQAKADEKARKAEQRDADRAEQAEEDRRAERRAERRARRAEQDAAAAAANDDGTAGEVVTESLTREDVRSSDQEFDTDVSAAGAEEKDDDDGLSKFEKALILGLGAVAVGTVLKNGDEVLSRSGDRVVVERDGELRVLKNDDALLRQPGNDVQTETFNDGSTRTIVTKPDSSQIITVRSADGTVLRRVSVSPQGEEVTLFDDTQIEREIVVSELPQIRDTSQQASASGEDDLRRALLAEQSARRGDAFSLRQVRDVPQVRAMAPQIELDAVRFESGSAAIAPEQARSLARIGNTLRDLIDEDPRTVLLVEGHTDAVGDATYNLALSDRRAETVALALTEYFDVPAENLIVQGYGESDLKVQTLTAEQANRRAVVRNITGLLR